MNVLKWAAYVDNRERDRLLGIINEQETDRCIDGE